MKVYFVSLGCDKNRVDSENMLGILARSGCEFTADERKADIIIINTCCFIKSAADEAKDTIKELSRQKSFGKCKRLIVTGCLAERYKEQVKEEFPLVDAIVGVNEISDVLKACAPASCALPVPGKRVITTPGSYEYLKIAEGCNKRCTYCVIPDIRGKYRSYRFEDVLNEAAYLADSGIKELILVAQETTLYGLDLYGENRLCALLKQLCKIDGLRWIRLLYTYPEDISDELLDTIAGEEKIVNYIDMPVQHASDKILKLMGRRTSRKDLENIILKARQIIPGVTLRTTVISGFPGELEEDHKELLSFIKQASFERLGCFTYSREEGTPAALFKGQIKENIKLKRQRDVMLLQQKISKALLEEKIGDSFDLIIDGFDSERGLYTARTYMDAPDVDGCFYLECEKPLGIGDFTKAVCTASDEYDLFGVAV